MKHEHADIIFDSRLTASVPLELRGAVERAANAQDVSLADFVRSAVSDKLRMLDVPHTRLPPLRRR